MAGKSTEPRRRRYETDSDDRDSVQSACRLYTGGAYCPVDHPRWQKLEKRLEQSGWTPSEFVYWACFVLRFKNGEKPGSAVLQRRSYLTSDETWDRFRQWKEQWPETIEALASSQRERVRAYSRTFGSTADVIRRHRMAAPVKADMILAQESPDTELLEQLLPEVRLMVRGSPEYLKVCPYLKSYLEV